MSALAEQLFAIGLSGLPTNKRPWWREGPPSKPLLVADDAKETMPAPGSVTEKALFEFYDTPGRNSGD